MNSVISQLAAKVSTKIQRLNFFSDLELYMRSAPLPELASRVAEWPKLSRAFDPYAVTFVFVSDLPTQERVKRNALRFMIFSPSFQRVLSRLDSKMLVTLRSSLKSSDQLVVIPSLVVESSLAEGVLSWKGQTLRDVLKCIEWAGGLALASQALEKWALSVYPDGTLLKL